MPESMWEIPALIILIFGLILGFWFAVPSEIDIGVMILEALAKAIQPLNIEQATRTVETYIILFRILRVVFIVLDVLGIVYLVIRIIKKAQGVL